MDAVVVAKEGSAIFKHSVGLMEQRRAVRSWSVIFHTVSHKKTHFLREPPGAL